MGAKNGSERPFQGEFLERDLHGFDREIGRVNRHVLGAAVLMERRSLTKKMGFFLDGDSGLGSFAHPLRVGVARRRANGDGCEKDVLRHVGEQSQG